MTPGNVLVLLSDGVEDRAAADGQPFGREQIEKVVMEAASGSAQEIADALMVASGNHGLGSDGEMDDRTIVVLKAR
jgi:serine phosphatase RsbU (regulator of sigma subunit)